MTAIKHSQPNEIIFSDGEGYFASLINDISYAKKSIDLETYIFHADQLGEQIILALCQAAQRGVKVRVMVDGAGSPTWGGKLTRNLEQCGAQTRVFHPFPWRLWHWSRSVVKMPFILKWLYLILKINSRDHRKACIIDKEIAYVGSHNISQCHLSIKNQGSGWRDTTVRLTNINLSDLTAAFEAAWSHRPIKERVRNYFDKIKHNPTFRLNNTRHRRRILYKMLLRRMSHCKTRIWITNAYFVPDHRLLNTLKEAAAKKVDVRILLPKKSDVFMMTWASSAFFRSLLKSGVRIFEYLPSMLHAKTLIIDDWVTVGSSNLNHRSLLHDLEIDVNLTNKASLQKLELLFLEDIINSNEIQLEDWHHRSKFQRFMGRLLLYVKYVI